MTPKDKAVELVWKYYHNIEHTISNEYASKDWEIAKQYALIAVDEIINCDSFFKTLEDTKEFAKYWYEVQYEIEKL